MIISIVAEFILFGGPLADCTPDHVSSFHIYGPRAQNKFNILSDSAQQDLFIEPMKSGTTIEMCYI